MSKDFFYKQDYILLLLQNIVVSIPSSLTHSLLLQNCKLQESRSVILHFFNFNISKLPVPFLVINCFKSSKCEILGKNLIIYKYLFIWIKSGHVSNLHSNTKCLVRLTINIRFTLHYEYSHKISEMYIRGKNQPNYFSVDYHAHNIASNCNFSE